MRTSCLTLLVIVLTAFCSIAQDPAADSLTQAFRVARQPEQRFDIADELVQYWAEVNFDSSRYYARQLQSLARQLGDPAHGAKALLRMGTPFDYYSHFDSAAYYYRKSKEYSETFHDDAGLANASFALATIYYFAGDYLRAIDEYKKVEQMFIAVKDDKRLSRLYNNLGVIYRKLEQYTPAIENFRQSLVLKERAGDQKGILKTYTNLSTLYYENGEFAAAEETSLKVINLSRTWKNPTAYKGELANLGIIYKKTNRPDAALQYLKELESSLEPADPLILKVDCWSNLATVYFDLKDYRRCGQYLDQVHEHFADLTPEARIAHLLMSATLKAAQGRYQEAYQLHLQYVEEQTKLTGETIRKKAKEFEIQYGTERKERQIAELELEKQRAALTLAQNRSQRNLLVAVIAGLLGIAGLIFYQYRLKQRSNNLLNEKNAAIARALEGRETLLREIHHRVKNNLQVISSLLSLQSRNLTDESARFAVSESRNRVKSMSLIHEQLYQEDMLSGLDMPDYVSRLVESLTASYGVDSDKIRVQLDCSNMVLDVDTAIPIGLILNELISNTFKYAYSGRENGTLEIVLHQQPNVLLLVVADDGVGFEEASQSQSFGLSLVNSLLRKLKADMRISHHNGTRVEITMHEFKLVPQLP